MVSEDENIVSHYLTNLLSFSGLSDQEAKPIVSFMGYISGETPDNIPQFSNYV